jgi:hypothetical protein
MGEVHEAFIQVLAMAQALELVKVSIEWTWVSLAYNLKRMHRVQWAGWKPSQSTLPGFCLPVASTN